MNLTFPVSQLNRVGKSSASALKRLGILIVGDLLKWFPFRYEDYRQILIVKNLTEGQMVTVRVKVELINNRRSFRSRKMVTEALVSDESGSIRVVWFNQPFIAKILKAGDEVFLSGKIKSDMLGNQLVNPIYEKCSVASTAHTARLVPIYPLTAGLTQKQLRFLIKQVLPLTQFLPDWLPGKILKAFSLFSLSTAVRAIHFPENERELKSALERLKFNELFLEHLKAEISRRRRLSEKAPKMIFQEKEIRQFVSGLPFVLTPWQKKSAWEILQDTQKIVPMNRLLSGDVGSGKTVVAAIAAYNTALSTYQAVVMTPTEILAKQHYDTFKKLLGDKMVIGLLTRSQYQVSDSQEKKTKKQIVELIEKGEIQIVIGTHALLTEKVEFNDVGLIIVDEQHRFGVAQRKSIKDKTAATSVHYLSMTATPIPRSLALVLFGDLDVSRLAQLPRGRKPIITRFVEPKNRGKAYDFIRAQIKQGRQAFVVCPLISQKTDETKKTKSENDFVPENYPFGSQLDEKKSVMGEYAKLSEEIFPDLRIGFLHGKMKAGEKEKTMEKFKNKEMDILVSTSVVEVGVDVPNASVMMIEGGEGFGLAQLHQFRGRVGRAEHQSYCFVFSDSISNKVKERLDYFEKNLDGFKLAEKDLETRGPGEVYGAAQSGMMRFRLARLTDKEIMNKARQAAVMVAGEIEKFPKLQQKLVDWEKVAHLE